MHMQNTETKNNTSKGTGRRISVRVDIDPALYAWLQTFVKDGKRNDVINAAIAAAKEKDDAPSR